MNSVAIVFDTNFIIQNRKMDKVLSELEEGYTGYVTQVSIEERIAQQCRDLKQKFDYIPEMQSEYHGIATVKLTTTYEAKAAQQRSTVQAAYDKTFGENIIPFQKDEKTYAEVLERAFMKIPPFLSEERTEGKPNGKANGKSPSDKGFKDTLIWISILQYFKEHGESRVVFLTDDGGFLKQSTTLCEEFNHITGKRINIKDNTYFCELTKTDTSTPVPAIVHKAPQPDVRQLRERIRVVINAMCGFEVEGLWGQSEWLQYFTLNEKVDISYVAVFLSGLATTINDNLFNQTIPAYNVVALDDRVTNGDYEIPITALEDVLKLYNDIQTTYPQYMQQFYSTAAGIINENYAQPKIVHDVFDDDFPF